MNTGLHIVEGTLTLIVMLAIMCPCLVLAAYALAGVTP